MLLRTFTLRTFSLLRCISKTYKCIIQLKKIFSFKQIFSFRQIKGFKMLFSLKTFLTYNCLGYKMKTSYFEKWCQSKFVRSFKSQPYKKKKIKTLPQRFDESFFLVNLCLINPVKQLGESRNSLLQPLVLYRMCI